MVNAFAISFGQGPHQFGGQPSLAVGMEWPKGPNGPLLHLMTMQLDDILNAQTAQPVAAEPNQPEKGTSSGKRGPDFSPGQRLPNSGQLVIFIDPTCAGYDPKDAGSCRVVHLKAGATLQPADGPSSLAKQNFDLNATWVEPARGSIFAVSPGKQSREEEPENHLLGFPFPEQRNTMELQCQLTSNGFYTGNDSGYNDPRAQIVKAGADQWRLLLQLQSFPELPLMFGDQGVLYLFCPLDDLGRMDLAKCWQLIQS